MKHSNLFSSTFIIIIALIFLFPGTKTDSQDLKRREPVIIHLPSPDLSGSTSLEETIKNRRSTRVYSKIPITKKEISQILWAAYGITKPNSKYKNLRGGYRTVPSAGALYPLEIYICSGNVEDLPDGIYWYRSEEHKLIKVISGDQRGSLCATTVGQKHFQNAAAILVIAANFQRTEAKYGERGKERYVYMEAGHCAQNIYLQSAALDIGVCAVGAFNDKRVMHLLQMKEEQPLYLIPMGKIINSKGKY